MVEYVSKRLKGISLNTSNKVVFFVEGMRLEKTFLEFSRDVMSFISHVSSVGNSMSKICIVGETSYEWLVADIAALYAGWMAVGLPESLPATELSQLVEDEAPDVVVKTPSRLNDWSHTEGLVLYCNKKGELSINGEPLRIENKGFIEPKVREDYTVSYSSGTSGSLKRIPSYFSSPSKRKFSLGRYIRHKLTRCVKPYTLWGKKNNTMMIYMPFSHSQQRGFASMALFNGYNLVLSNPQSAFLHLIKEKPNMMVSVPTLYETIYHILKERVSRFDPKRKKRLEFYQKYKLNTFKSTNLLKRYIDKRWWKDLHKYMGSRPDFFVTGSAPISKECIDFFYSIGIHLLEAYGQSELGAISMSLPGKMRPGSVGKPLMEIKIAEDGEVLVKKPKNKLEEGLLKIDEDGFVHTGDMGYMKDGYLYLKGRKDDVLLLSNGKKVFPQKLENELRTWQGIKNAFVFLKEGNQIGVLIDLEKSESKNQINKRLLEWNDSVMTHESIKLLSFSAASFSVKNGFLTRNFKLQRNRLEEACQRMEWSRVE